MAKKSNLQINFEYYFVRIVLAFLGALPRRGALFVCKLLFDFAYLIFGRLRRIALINTKIAFPDKCEKERLKLVRGCFHNLGRQVAELSQFSKATPESLKQMVVIDISEERMEEFHETKRSGRGLVFLTPHFGGWEVLAFVAFIFLEPQSYLVRRLDNPKLEELLAEIRGKFGNKPLDKASALMPALRLLRSGGNLGILPDLNTQEHEGVFVPFFGKQASTTAGVAAIVMRTKAAAILFSAAWDAKTHKYIIRMSDTLEFESSGDRKQDIVDFTAKISKEIENVVRRDPEQYFWIHKRWNTRPKGEIGIY